MDKKLTLNERLFLITSGYIPMTSLLLLMIYNDILDEDDKKGILTDKQASALELITTLYDIFFYYEYLDIRKEEYEKEKTESLKMEIIATELGLASSFMYLYALILEK